MATIQIRGKKKHIYIRFYYQGRQCKEPTNYYCEGDSTSSCNCNPCNAMRTKADTIQLAIKERIFCYAEAFPHSKALTDIGFVTEKQDYMFQEYWQEWLAEKMLHAKPNSISKFKSNMLKVFPVMGHLKIKEAHAHHIKSMLKTLIDEDYSPKTIKCIMADISSVFYRAVLNGLIVKNPCSTVKTPKVPKADVDPFNLDEVKRILAWVGDNHPEKLLYFAIAFLTGMRPGEIVGLKWNAINLGNRKIYIYQQHTKGKVSTPKTNEERVIDILPQLVAYIEQHKKYTYEKSEYVFLNQYGKPYMTNRDFVRYCWNDCLDALNIRRRPIKQTRHTFACIMIQNNMDREWVARKMLGHTSKEMLDAIYARYVPAPPEDGKFNFMNKVVRN